MQSSTADLDVAIYQAQLAMQAAQPVPEPGSLLLLATAIAALIAAKWRMT